MSINPGSAIDVLNDRVSPIGKRYEAAWKAYNDPEANVEERCHAYVWLGYRVLEESMLPEHREIPPGPPDPEQIEDHASRARWAVSIYAVNSYIECLLRDNPAPLLRADEYDFRLDAWPNNLSTMCRMMAASAYAAHLGGDSNAAIRTARKTISAWQEAMATIDITTSASEYRFAEMLNEALPLQVCSIIANQGERQKHQRWILDRLDKQPPNINYWWKCIRKLEVSKRSLFAVIKSDKRT